MDDGQKRDIPVVPSGHGKITTVFLLNIPLSDVGGWSEVSPSRTYGFQGIGSNFFAIAPPMSANNF